MNKHHTLNTQQEKAVYPKKGVFLVVAGAGSGKTRIITSRIEHLIECHSVSPSEILALTFTNKAATEMRKRVKDDLAGVETIPFIGTFHAYCLYLLKKHYYQFSNTSFSILDESDKQSLLKKRIQYAGIQKQITPKQASYQISIIKNSSINHKSHLLLQQNKYLAQLYSLYEEERKASHALDFDDLLIEALSLFTKNAFKLHFQNTISHILIDEYQDTNIIQHALLKQMALNETKLAIESLCAVGDEDQSIYSWRGATVSNILNFPNEFPDTTIVTVDQNYRSVNIILDVANSVICHNKQRNPKKLWSEKKASDRIRALSCASENQEANIISLYIKQCSYKKDISIAILYRAHFQSRLLEEALIKSSIPYTIVGGTQFYERKEIKDLLAYLRLIVNPFDRPSFFRIINCPSRGLGAKFEELFHSTWLDNPSMNFKEIAHYIIEQKLVVGIKKKQLEQFVSYFKEIDQTTNILQALHNIIHEINYYHYLQTNYDKTEVQVRIDNIQELIRAFEYFISNGIHTIRDVLDEISLLTDHNNNDNKKEHNKVFLMTLHASKGLEFDIVIITGTQENLLPSPRALSEEAIEEERRLFYVGITRAKEYLLLTCSYYRSQYGVTAIHEPSRFLNEIPPKYLTLQDTNYWLASDFSTFFANWMGIKNLKSNAIFFSSKTGTQKKDTPSKTWKIYQTVEHKQFGTGIVKKVDIKSNTKTYLTISFKNGTKKIDANFVTHA